MANIITISAYNHPRAIKRVILSSLRLLRFREIHSEVLNLSDFSKFIDLFENSKRIAVLTGAGVSTLSGIPDFRSSDGLYSKKFGHMSVESLLDIDFFIDHPDEFYKWKLVHS